MIENTICALSICFNPKSKSVSNLLSSINYGNKITNHHETKCKVAIVKSKSNITIKLENGGGSRSVMLNHTDHLWTIRKKIVDLYFQPGSKLGNRHDYDYTLLDFQRHRIEQKNLLNFYKYKEKHGLTNREPLFFLQIEKKNVNYYVGCVRDDHAEELKVANIYDDYDYKTIKETIKDLFYPSKLDCLFFFCFLLTRLIGISQSLQSLKKKKRLTFFLVINSFYYDLSLDSSFFFICQMEAYSICTNTHIHIINVDILCVCVSVWRMGFYMRTIILFAYTVNFLLLFIFIIYNLKMDQNMSTGSVCSIRNGEKSHTERISCSTNTRSITRRWSHERPYSIFGFGAIGPKRRVC